MRSAYAETVFSSCEVESKEIKGITLRARHYTSLGTQVVTEDKRQKIVKKLIRKYRNRAMTLNLIHQSLQIIDIPPEGSPPYQKPLSYPSHTPLRTHHFHYLFS